MNLWFFLFVSSKSMQFKKFQLKHDMWQFWERVIGSSEGGTNDPGMWGNEEFSSLTYFTSTFQKYLYSNQVETEIVIKNHTRELKYVLREDSLDYGQSTEFIPQIPKFESCYSAKVWIISTYLRVFTKLSQINVCKSSVVPN